MRVFFLSLLLACVPLSALAQNVQLKGGTVSIGDSIERLLKVAGEPDQVRPFPGSPATTVYEYSSGSRQVNISTKNGKITGIADNNIVSTSSPKPPTGVQLNGSRVVTGDTLGKLLQVAGKPSRVRSFSGVSIYEYSLVNREVTVTVRDGKVTGTSEIKVVEK